MFSILRIVIVLEIFLLPLTFGLKFQENFKRPDMPVTVNIQDQAAIEPTAIAALQLDLGLGANAILITVMDSSAPIQLSCKTSEYLNRDNKKKDGIILAVTGIEGKDYSHTTIQVDCSGQYGDLVTTIAHEMLHAIGLWEHSVNPGCLNYAYDTGKTVEEGMCPEILDWFKTTYPELVR